MTAGRRVAGTALAALAAAALGGCGDGDATAPAAERSPVSDLLAYAGGSPAAAMALGAESARRLAAGDDGAASLLGNSAVAAARPLAAAGLDGRVRAALVAVSGEDGPAWVAWLLDGSAPVDPDRLASRSMALDGDVLVTADGPAGLRAARAASSRADADSPLRRDLAGAPSEAPIRLVADASAVAAALDAEALAPRLRGVRLHAESRADGTEVLLSLRGLAGDASLPSGAEHGWELPSSDTIGVSVSVRDPAQMLAAAARLVGASRAGGRSTWERRADRALGIDVRRELLERMSALTVSIEAACPPPGVLACHPAVTLQARLDEPRRFARVLRAAASRLPRLFAGLGFGPLRVVRDGNEAALVTRERETPVAYAIDGSTFVAQVGVIPLRVARTERAPALRGRLVGRGSGAVLRSILPRSSPPGPALDCVLAALGRFRFGIWADGPDVFASLTTARLPAGL